MYVRIFKYIFIIFVIFIINKYMFIIIFEHKYFKISIFEHTYVGARYQNISYHYIINMLYGYI